MPDTFTATLNLNKPAPGSIDWAPKLSGDMDIIDTLGPRLTAVEGRLGGAVAGVTRVASGSGWGGILAAYANAPNNPLARHSIITANEPIEQTSAIQWLKHVDLRGSGSASEIICRGNISQFGASDAFIIGADINNPLNGLVFSDFKYSHDRATGGAGMRNNPFSIGDYNQNIVLKNIDFQDITANCIQILRNNTGTVKNIFILNCTADEWYEAVIIADGSAMDGIYIIGNSGSTSAGSPLGGTSRPQGVFIGNEQMVLGLIKNVVIAKNHFDFTPMGGNNGQTLGITLATGFQTGGTPGPLGEIWRYDRIVIQDNTVIHADVGIRAQGNRGESYGSQLIADWELDTPSVNEAGTTYLDSHYYNNLHLTKSGSPTQAAGHLGTCTVFTRASSQFLFHANAAPFNQGDTFWTIQAWVNIASKPAGPMVIASEWDTSGNNRGWSLYWDNVTDRFIWAMSADGTTVVTASSAAPPTIGTWYLVTGDYLQTTDEMGIRIDAGTTVLATLAGGAFASTAQFRIAADVQGNYWDGKIEKVRMWKNALANAAGVAKGTKIYNSGVGLSYQTLDDIGGLTHTAILDNYIDDCTAECISVESGSPDYFDISGNECHINSGQSGVGVSPAGPILSTGGRPNKIVPRF